MYTLEAYLEDKLRHPKPSWTPLWTPWSEKLSFGHDPGVHFEHHVESKFRKNHREPKRVGHPKPSWTPLWTPWSEKLPFGHDPGLHFEHHVDPKFGKNHQEPKKVGARKTRCRRIDFRSLLKGPNMASTSQISHVLKSPPMRI